MVIPIRALRDGAARIGHGDLRQRIAIDTGDELQELGNQFNRMAAKLQDSYATLERKVEERTHQLELANLAKSRFLAVASHDLRQPLHALGLFVSQLRTVTTASERARVVGRIDTAIATMNELFKALLDISRLDAGALAWPNVTEFPVVRLLERVDATFAGAAADAGLNLRVVPNSAWVRSDFILLERVVLNLVSNAVRYTARGGVLIGCRKRGQQLRIEVWDTGSGRSQRISATRYSESFIASTTCKVTAKGLASALPSSTACAACSVIPLRTLLPPQGRPAHDLPWWSRELPRRRLLPSRRWWPLGCSILQSESSSS